MSTILLAVAIGVAVPVLLLVGPYLPYLRPVRRRRSPSYADGKLFSQALLQALRREDGQP